MWAISKNDRLFTQVGYPRLNAFHTILPLSMRLYVECAQNVTLYWNIFLVRTGFSFWPEEHCCTKTHRNIVGVQNGEAVAKHVQNSRLLYNSVLINCNNTWSTTTIKKSATPLRRSCRPINPANARQRKTEIFGWTNAIRSIERTPKTNEPETNAEILISLLEDSAV